MDHPVLQLFINANKSRDLHFSRLRSGKNQLTYGYVGATPTAHALWRLPALRVVYTPTVRELKNYSKFIYYKISMQREVTSVVFKVLRNLPTITMNLNRVLDIQPLIEKDRKIWISFRCCHTMRIFIRKSHRVAVPFNSRSSTIQVLNIYVDQFHVELSMFLKVYLKTLLHFKSKQKMYPYLFVILTFIA